MTIKEMLWPHGARCFIGRCDGHGMHAPALFGGWIWAHGIPKRLVNYRPADLDGHDCGSCLTFTLDTGRCTLVAGTVSVLATCDQWTERP
jgi:hypothetical protein